MPKKNINTTNSTLIKLHGTPFKSATELKAHEEHILLEEWENVERARVRRELLLKAHNREILAPLLNGLSAKFVGPKSEKDNLVKVFLTDQHHIQVDIDAQLKQKEVGAISDSLVKSLVSGLISGYLSALGLTLESQIQTRFSPAPVEGKKLK